MRKTKKPKEPAAGAETAKGITAITVAGFKSIRDEQTIEIRPLTILAGANSSGKSSIMQPLLLMKQTLEQSFDPGPLWLRGPHVQFSNAEEFLSRDNLGGRVNSFRIGVECDSRATVTTFCNYHGDRPKLEIYKTCFTPRHGREICLRPDMTNDEIVFELPPVPKSQYETIRKNKVEASWSVERHRCFLIWKLQPSTPVTEVTVAQLLAAMTLHPGDRVESLVRSLIHVPGIRGNPERYYPVTATGPDFEGTFEHYAGGLIAQWDEQNDPQIERLSKVMNRLGLGWLIRATRKNDVSVELTVPRLPTPSSGGDVDMVNIADVGLGVSQTIPVLVATMIADAGRTLYVDEPELHLHPRAQVAMAEVLADAAKRGVRVVAETHSSLLLLGIQTLVAEGKLSPDLVKLHWFSRNEEGFTQITSTNLDEAGRFETEWPEDFGDIELDLQGRYLDATEKRQLGL